MDDESSRKVYCPWFERVSIPARLECITPLGSICSAFDDLGGLPILGRSIRLSGGLKGLDDVHARVWVLFVTFHNRAENDVLVVEPRRDDGRDEELGSVPLAAFSTTSAKITGEMSDFTYVLGPALAMERRPGSVCFKVKFSSANFSP